MTTISSSPTATAPRSGCWPLESAARPGPAPPLPLRRARCPDPGHDRLLPPPGPRERPPGSAGRQPRSARRWSSVDDPAFADPTKFVGPIYSEARRPSSWPRCAAGRSAATARPGGGSSPRPSRWRSSSSDTIRALVDAGAIVICAGGGGIPVGRSGDGRSDGVEAVVDKDLTAVAPGHGSRRRRAPDPHRRRQRRDRLRHAAPIRSAAPRPVALRARLYSPPGRWDPRSRPPAASSRPRESVPSSDASLTLRLCSMALVAPRSSPSSC